MNMKITPNIKWLKKPSKHDYPAAESYLNLIYNKTTVTKLIKRFNKAPIITFKAKDIFRASQLSLLGISNSHVIINIEKINKGISLSPVLLVRDTNIGKVIIADGYHRICGVYTFNEDAIIPCKIINLL